LPFIIAGLALLVIGVFTMQPIAMGFVGQAAQSAKATAVGLYVCLYYIGGSVGAVLPGVLVWNTAGWPGCVIMVMLTLGLATVLAWIAWREEPKLCAAE
jgi:sugar phosphate permease